MAFVKIPAFPALCYGIPIPQGLARGTPPTSAREHGKSIPRHAVHGGIFTNGPLLEQKKRIKEETFEGRGRERKSYRRRENLHRPDTVAASFPNLTSLKLAANFFKQYRPRRIHAEMPVPARAEAF